MSYTGGSDSRGCLVNFTYWYLFPVPRHEGNWTKGKLCVTSITGNRLIGYFGKPYPPLAVISGLRSDSRGWLVNFTYWYLFPVTRHEGNWRKGKLCVTSITGNRLIGYFGKPYPPLAVISGLRIRLIVQ